MKKQLLLSLFPVLLLSCSSGKKALQQGNYEEAVYQSVQRLRQSPNNRKAAEVLSVAYPELLEYNLDRIRRLQATADPLKWDDIARLYTQLNQAYDAIQRSPAAKELYLEARDFTPEFEEARQNAARAYYSLAEERLTGGRGGDREAAKEAYGFYRQAEDWVPRFRDAAEKAEEARYLATLWVQVDPIPIHSRSLEISNEFFQNKLFEYLRSAPINEFVRFIGPGESPGRGRQPDQLLQLAFDDFIVGQSAIRERVLDRKRDSVVVGTVEVIEEGEKVVKDVYGEVQAEVHLFEKQVQSSGLLDLRIVEPRSGQVIAQEKFSGTHLWIDYWGFFNGDERALNEEDRNKLRKSREVQPPPPQQLFIEFTVPIYDQLTGFVRDHYRYY